jgi:hypothetical protein
VNKTKKTIAIFGSCVSRDPFNSKFNPTYKENFEVVLLENQTSLLTLISSPIVHNSNSLDPLSDWDRKTTLSELDKSFLPTLKSLQPDILIVDFFADSRFKTIAYENSFFTVNDWKNTKTNIYKKMLKESTPFFPTEIQLAENMKKLYDFCKQELPNTTIILNKARAVSSYIDKHGKENFYSKDLITKINLRWEKLDRLWLEIAPSTIGIDVMTAELKGDINHPWGDGYVHYTPSFYQDFLFSLNLALDEKHIENIKSILSGLIVNNTYVKEKALQIKEISIRYSLLGNTDKEILDSWLDGRYKKVLKYIEKYQKNPHDRIDFAYDIFRWGQKGITAQDIDFSHYLIMPIIHKEIATKKETFDYALFTYGTIMFHTYRESVNNNRESVSDYTEALKSLLLSSKAKSTYIQQRSFYFLSMLYSYKNEFNKSLINYVEAISFENVPSNQYPLIYTLLTKDISIDLGSIFKDINQIFSKENITSHTFWKVLIKNLEIDSVRDKINNILKFNLFGDQSTLLNEKSEKNIVVFAKLLSEYYSCSSLKKDRCDMSKIQSLYNNTSLTDKGKSFILSHMAEQTRDVHYDLNRSMLMFSESINLYMNKNRFIDISNLLLTYFDDDIRQILILSEYKFLNLAVQRYCYEQGMGKSAWSRFINEGFVTGYIEEEIEFLEYIKERTLNVDLKRLLSTRLAFLYYKGHAGIRIHDYNQPNYHKSEKLFKELVDNPLVSKYLKHPILSIYNEIETVNKDTHYIYFENKKSHQLIIVFACAFGYAHYSQLYSFYQKNQANVLFLNNPKLNWYHGTEWNRVSKTIEKIVAEDFDKKNVISYFGSMGGYMALKVGLTYGFKTIVFNPQIDMNIWIKHRPVLEPRLREEKELINIQDFDVKAFESTPIYYMTSSSIEDVEAFKIFIEKISLCSNGLFIIEKISNNIHAGIFGKVYKEHQQDVILNISKLQDKYFPTNNYDKIEYKIPKELHKVFWDTVISYMEIRLIIQIINGEILVAKAKEDFSKKIAFSEFDFREGIHP